MKPELTPSEAVSIMQDAGSTLSLESFKRCLRQDKIPGGLYVASEGQGQSAIYKVFALPFFVCRLPCATTGAARAGNRLTMRGKRKPRAQTKRL